MDNDDFRDARMTERRNPRTVDLDLASASEIVDLMNAEDATVAAAVRAAREAIARTVDLAADALRAGGRLIYVGTGTSGRLGVLDAAECPPTFGTDPAQVTGIIAGGIEAIFRSVEDAEDDAGSGAGEIDRIGAGDRDLVVGIAASGSTPYVGGALRCASRRGARTALVACADPAPALADGRDAVIVARVGPEALTGSTRLKAGTATKMILNTITTGAMVLIGRTYGNFMVDLLATNAKLADRAERIVMEAGEADRDTARRAIVAAAGAVKTAVVMVRTGVSAAEAARRLAEAGGRTREAAGDPPPVTS